MSKDKIRQYLRPDAGQKVESWPWPDMAEDGRKRRPGGNALGYVPPLPAVAPAVELEPEEQPEPLTAEALDAIRQAAYDEGYEEGRQQGFEQGREEGRLTGLQQGHEAGLAQGLEQGLTEGQERIDELAARWQQLLEQLSRPLAAIDKAVEQSLVTLALELARNLLKAEAETSPRLLLATVQEAVAALPGQDGQITLYLHPEDIELLQRQYDQESLGRRGWELVPEPGFERGSLRLKTALSTLDTSLAGRIDQLMANFIKANWSRFHGPK
jgi:flagellar assembly protein FliH